MKTQYQKMYKYGIDAMVFGKAKKKDHVILWIMIGIIFVLGLMI